MALKGNPPKVLLNERQQKKPKSEIEKALKFKKEYDLQSNH